MKSLFTFLVAALMVLSFSVTGFANSTNGNQTITEETQSSAVTSQRTTESTDHQMMTYTGKVVSVNTTDQTMVVKGKEGERTFDVSKMSTAVKPGDRVEVSYYTDPSGLMVVSSVSSGAKTSSMERDRYYDYGTSRSGYGASEPGTGGVMTGSDIGGYGGMHSES